MEGGRAANQRSAFSSSFTLALSISNGFGLNIFDHSFSNFSTFLDASSTFFAISVAASSNSVLSSVTSWNSAASFSVSSAIVFWRSSISRSSDLIFSTAWMALSLLRPAVFASFWTFKIFFLASFISFFAFSICFLWPSIRP